VIALTASTGEDEIAACRAAGMAGWVCKPIEPALLFAEIQAVMSGESLPRAAEG
jgi:CheY-like chemotaxis protein